MFDHPSWRARPLATACRLLTCRVRQQIAPLHNPVIPYDEGRARMQVDVTTAFGYTLYRYGHQDADADLVRALLAPGDFFIDGGAHVGLITLVAAARVGEGGKGLAFEPAEGTRAALERNLALSGFGWVEARREALADTAGTRAFTAFSHEAWGSSSFAPPSGLPGQRMEQAVQVTTLDAVVPPSDYSRLRLIKLDLEGAEYAALRGATEVLRHAGPDLLIELEADHLKRQGASVDDVAALLRALGYRFFRAVSASSGVALEPLDDLRAEGGHSPNVYATRDIQRAESAGIQVRNGVADPSAQTDTQNPSAPVAPSLAALSAARAVPARWLVPLLLVVLSCAFLYRAPYNASALEIVPDSVEYAVGAQRIALLGRYKIEINHAGYPPRYAPWFSLLLSPVYRLTHGAMGSGIVVVFAFALSGVLALYIIGCRIGAQWTGMRPEWGGAGAVLCLLAFKEYRMLARYVMTDAPAAAIGLLCCALYLRMQARRGRRDYLLAGGLTALAAAMRYEGFVLLFPFLVLSLTGGQDAAKNSLQKPVPARLNAQGSRLFVNFVNRLKSQWRNLALLCAPTAFVACATALYNARTFGSWRRSGYHYWNAVPYDYASLVWSPRYVSHNLFVLAAKQSLLIVIVGAVGLLLLRRRPNPALNAVLRFLGWACVPAGVAHLFYFSSDVRFYVLLLTLWGGIGGVGLATLLPSILTRSPRWLAWGLAASLLTMPLIRRAFDSEPARRIDADALACLTPPDAVIVTELDAVYLEPLVLRGTPRRVIPLTREVEYADKAIVVQRIAHPDPPPRDAQDARSPGMLAGGARDVFAYTADEAPEKVVALARAGVPIYVDLRFAPKGLDVLALFRSAPGINVDWMAVPAYAWLKQMRVRPAAARP